MDTTMLRTLVRSLALGFACGLRSMAGPAALAFGRGREECAGCVPPPLKLIRSDFGRAGIAAAALGELVVDKTPLAPPRVALGPLAGRVVIGGASGFLATRSTPAGRSLLAAGLGTIGGGAGAAIGSFAGFRSRRAASEAGLADLPVALIEDATAYSIATAAVRWRAST